MVCWVPFTAPNVMWLPCTDPSTVPFVMHGVSVTVMVPESVPPERSSTMVKVPFAPGLVVLS